MKSNKNKVEKKTNKWIHLLICMSWYMYPPNASAQQEEILHSSSSLSRECELLSSRDLQELNDSDNALAVISMLMHGEGCGIDELRALNLCLYYIREVTAFDVGTEEYSFVELAVSLLIKHEKLHEAEKLLAKFSTKTSMYWMFMGDIELLRGHLKKAAEFYDESIKLDKSNIYTGLRLSHLYQIGVYKLSTTSVSDSPWIRALKRQNRRWSHKVHTFTELTDSQKLVFFSSAVNYANAGVPAAMYFIHLIHERGCGVIPQNKERSNYWLYNAQKAGFQR